VDAIGHSVYLCYFFDLCYQKSFHYFFHYEKSYGQQWRRNDPINCYVLTKLCYLSYFRECNKRGSVLSVLNDFYHGSYQQLYTVWRNQHKTIEDSGFVLSGELLVFIMFSLL
jgi:hypothetical protein